MIQQINSHFKFTIQSKSDYNTHTVCTQTHTHTSRPRGFFLLKILISPKLDLICLWNRERNDYTISILCVCVFLHIIGNKTIKTGFSYIYV